MKLYIHVVNESPTLNLPEYTTQGAAGMDVRACFDCSREVLLLEPTYYKIEVRSEVQDVLTKVTVDENSTIVIPPRGRALIPTGLRLEIPSGFKVNVRPRSGLALKQGVTVLNSPGLIDSDYRGPLGIILINHSNTPFTIQHGDRVAQIELEKVIPISFLKVAELSDTDRAEGGFGHSGVK